MVLEGRVVLCHRRRLRVEVLVAALHQFSLFLSRSSSWVIGHSMTNPHECR
jgi:hypothetical protein